MANSEDEFDSLPDPFADVDWATVPDLGLPDPHRRDQQAQPSTSTTNPTDLEGSSQDAVRRPSALPSDVQSSPSSNYFSDDLDERTLAQVDEVVRTETRRASTNKPTVPRDRAIAALFAGPPSQSLGRTALEASSSRANTSRHFAGRPPNSRNGDSPTSSKRPRTPTRPIPKLIDSSPRKKGKTEFSSPSAIKKGKQKEDTVGNAILDVLDTFDDDITCPICCDTFVAAHVGNPCGHCFCGECGWAWISKNRRHPTCAICRGQLSGDSPMIPNYTLDSLVEKHINALGGSGDRDWLPGGVKLKDWHGRKEKWKNDLAKRAEKPKSTSSNRVQRQPLPPAANLVEQGGIWHVPRDEEDDESHRPSGSEEDNPLLDEVAEIVHDAISRALSGGQSETRGGGQSGGGRRGGRSRRR
ncbi:hypothetical protein OE88DRAFT_140020 [Heliocybe sulcata]|uniref:RING-type domain-containing protein n=1 Tax=Heliocybe sulcata TaxID=5364 RepID=A0A5C3NHU3_9AGAM|nr:hypothetical protein OE88DRAFT_140020 [Heliocybe sulcata]